MRYLILLLSFFFLIGCDDSSSITSPSQTTDTSTTIVVVGYDTINISGKVDVSNAGSLNVTTMKAYCAGIVSNLNTDGSYHIFGLKPRYNTSARMMGNLDTVKIIVGTDTMIEIPVSSLKDILPTNYLVKRNVSVEIPRRFVGNSIQTVYWNNDSIAHVLKMFRAGNNWTYSAFFYTYYNDSNFVNDDTILNLFVRIKIGDSVRSFTEITPIVAGVGDIVYDTSDFRNVVEHIKYKYSFVPEDSSLTRWHDTLAKKLVIDTSWDTIEYFWREKGPASLQNLDDSVHFESVDSVYSREAIWDYRYWYEDTSSFVMIHVIWASDHNDTLHESNVYCYTDSVGFNELKVGIPVGFHNYEIETTFDTQHHIKKTRWFIFYRTIIKHYI